MPTLPALAIALCAALVIACKEREIASPSSAWTAPSESLAEPSRAPVAEPLSTGPSGGLVVPWRRVGACDPTGTWRIELSPQRLFCEGMAEESFELALGFVRENGRTVLAAAGRPVGKRGKLGGKLGGLLGSMQVSLLTGPYAGCEVRLLTTQGRGERATRVEMLFSVHEDELDGYGARWRSPAMCNEPFALFGERTTPTPGEWARLGDEAPPMKQAAPRPADAALASAVANIRAASLLGPQVTKASTTGMFGESTEHAVRTPLRGSIVEYVAAVVGHPRDVSLVEVPCSEPRLGRCVAVHGDPCRPEYIDPEDDCEGMFLNVVVDVERARLDRADNIGYPVRSHADIAGWEIVAP